MPAGRPTIYSDELVDIICSRISGGESLKRICECDDMPGKTIVFQWLGKYPEFLEKYEAAREAQAHLLAEETLEIADDGRNDWMAKNDPDNPGYAANGENIQRARLRVDARKWFASKLLPKKYGDRQAVELTGRVECKSTDEDDKIIERYLESKKRKAEQETSEKTIDE